MTTTTRRTVNRGMLLRAAKAGRLYVKCNYHMTDDYAFDNAVNCRKSDEFRQVYVWEEFPDNATVDAIHAAHEASRDANGRPRMPDPAILNPLQERLRQEQSIHEAEQDRKRAGRLMLTERDFKTKSGGAYGSASAGSFYVHSNLSYSFEVRA